MAITHTLSAGAMLATQSGNVFTWSADVPGFGNFTDAFTAQIGSNGDGSVIKCRVEHLVPASNSTFEVGEFTWANTAKTMTRAGSANTRDISSDGTTTSNNDQTFAGTVIIYAEITGKEFTELNADIATNVADIATNTADIADLQSDIRIYQKGIDSSGTDFSTTSLTPVAMSTLFTKTPTNASTKLMLKIATIDLRVRADTTGVNDTRCNAILYYKNSSGTWTNGSPSLYIGYNNITPYSGDPITYESPTLHMELTSSHYNPSGDWEYRLYGDVDYSDITLLEYAIYLSYEEYE